MQTSRKTSRTKIEQDGPNSLSRRRSSSTNAGRRPVRTSSSASSASSASWNSSSSWVFNQDYWRGPERPLSTYNGHRKEPVVIIIRHAQALHNVKQATRELQEVLYQTRDTPLTLQGVQQAASMPDRYPGLLQLARDVKGQSVKVFTSPLTRTLQTTYTAFPWLAAGQAVLAPDLQEVTNKPFDIGSAPSDLVKAMNLFCNDNKHLFTPAHFTALAPDWYKKEGPYAFKPDAILDRARRFRRYIKSLDLDYVVLVTHGGFMPSLCEDRNWQRSDNDTWNNAEARVFRFDPADKTGHAKLKPLPSRESNAILGCKAS